MLVENENSDAQYTAELSENELLALYITLAQSSHKAVKEEALEDEYGEELAEQLAKETGNLFSEIDQFVHDHLPDKEVVTIKMSDILAELLSIFEEED